MPNFPKKQQQCLIPKYLLDYATELNENHPDPSAEWGGGSGGDTIQAGEGIVITTESDDTKTISVDTEDVAMKTDIPTNYVTTDTDQTITANKTILNSTGTQHSLTVQNNLYGKYEWSNLAYNNLSIKQTQTGTGYNSYTVYKPHEISLVNDGTDFDFYIKIDTDSTYTFDKSKSGTVAVESDIPDAVSGTNDGTNWTSLTIGSDTYGLASGGTTYTAGTGIDITGTTISIDTSVVAEVSDIPTDTSDLTNGAGYITSNALNGYATEYWVGQQGYLTSVSWNDVSGKPTFATVATSGDYDDLINTPTIPTAVSQLTNDSGYITGITSSDVTTALGYTPGTSNFSGDYDDLTDKPTIPTVVNTVASGNMNAVTSNAVYDIVGDIETLLAAI